MATTPFETESTTLPSGLRVVSARMPHLASVSLGIWVGTGGRYETARENGAAHFIEHLLFKGTRNRSAARISQDIEGIGGYLNAFTDEELTCFYSRAVASRLPDLLDVLLDMFLQSRFAPAEIAKEREVILEEQSMYLDQPAEHVHDLLNAAQFPRHPLGRPVIGTRASVRRLDRPALLGFLGRHYVAQRTVVAAAGDMEHRELLRLVQAREAEFAQGSPAGPEPAPKPLGEPALKLHSQDTEQTHLALGFRTASRVDPRRFALRLLNVLFGENMSSRLFQVVREDNGLAYNIQSSVSGWSDCGDLVVSAGLDDGQLEKALRLILREARRLTERPPGRKELDRARDYALGQADLGLEGSEQVMMWLGEQMLAQGRISPPSHIKERLATVTPAEIRSVARDFLHAGGVSLALVSPRKDLRGLPELLGKSLA